jgi:hypothetical protein
MLPYLYRIIGCLRLTLRHVTAGDEAGSTLLVAEVSKLFRPGSMLLASLAESDVRACGSGGSRGGGAARGRPPPAPARRAGLEGVVEEILTSTVSQQPTRS